jgi:glycosyltransferase involved in cell wall biosynthesis
VADISGFINEDCRTVDAGSRIRDYHLLRALSRLGHLTVVAFQQRNMSRLPRRGLSCEYYDLGPPRRSLGAAIRAVSLQRLYHEYAFDFSGHSSRVNPILSRSNVAHASMLYPVLHLQRMLAGAKVRPLVIWDTQNFDPEVWSRRSETGGFVRRSAAYLQSQIIAERCAAAYNAADGVVVCSKSDGKKLEALRSDYGLSWKPTVLLENGFDDIEWAEARKNHAKRHAFVTFGSLTQPSTSAGVKWLLKEVWPQVSRSHPQATLTVAGREPPRELAELAARPGVRLVANPPSIPSVAGGASAVLIPQAWGTGSKLKVIEAVATGKPVIASPVAITGLEDLARYVTLAPTVQSWVDAIDTVLVSAAEPMSRPLDGSFVSRYSWTSIGERYLTFVRRLLASRGDLP